METNKILQADYLDIIYDRHNKKYGGYELRKSYDSRTRTALVYLMSGVAALIGLSFITVKDAPKPAHLPILREYDLSKVYKPEVEQPKVLPKAAQPPAQQPKMKLSTDPVITKDPVPDDKIMPQNSSMANVQPGPSNSDSGAADIGPGIAKTPSPGTGVVQPPADNKPVPWVPQMPEFVGDINAYIASHLQYPAVARESNISGKVLLRFVVNEDGSVSDVTILSAVGGGCDEEGARVVKGMPKWKPGRQNGVPVKVYFTLPIRFVLN